MKANIELFKNAISHEVKSVAYYDTASELTDNDETRMLFLELSDMEDDHIKKLMKKVASTEWPNGFDPEAYLTEVENSVAESFTEEELELMKTGDMRSILKKVIHHEEDTQRNYLGLIESVCNAEEKEFCQELHDDEGYHLASLRNLLLSLEMDDADRPAL